MKKLLLLLILSLTGNHAIGKQISIEQARLVALAELSGNIKLRSAHSLDLKLAYTAKNETKLRSEIESINYYYVFNINNTQGFIIISADDVNYPVIGYSSEGSFQTENQPENFKAWMKSIEKGMEKAITENKKTSKAITDQWNAYLSGKTKQLQSEKKVLPLITTYWDQNRPFNKLIPITDGGKEVLTGCVATAMAQIMKYYNYPRKGTGILKSYKTRTKGIEVPEINLNEYSYDWKNMLPSYTFDENDYNESEINAVGLLMFHCGASVETDYTFDNSSAGGMASSLANNFGYDKDILELSRNSENINDGKWISLIKEELDNNRPIYYRGTPSESNTGGHGFICDGYDENDLFHINWGWRTLFDGYYNINAPLEYTKNHAITFNIKPDEGGIGYLLNLKSQLEEVHKNENFKITFDISSSDSIRYSSILNIALYDESDKFVTTIDEIHTNNFSVCKVPDYTPIGKYKVKIVRKDTLKKIYIPLKFYPEKEEIYLTVKDGIAKYNHLIGILGSQYYEEYTDFSAEKTSVKVGENFKMKLSFINNGHEDFCGHYGAALTDSTDHIGYILSENLAETPLVPDYFHKTYTLNCKIPEHTLPDNYYLRFITKDVNSDKWNIVRAYRDFHYISNVTDKLFFTVVNNPVGMENTKKEQSPLHFNKAENILTINQEANISIYDSSGRLVLTDSESKKDISLTHLTKGIYIIKLKNQQGTTSHKIIKD